MDRIDGEISDLFFNLESSVCYDAFATVEGYALARANDLKEAYPRTFSGYTADELCADYVNRV